MSLRGYSLHAVLDLYNMSRQHSFRQLLLPGLEKGSNINSSQVFHGHHRHSPFLLVFADQFAIL